jgi:hypothetical protein
MQNYTFKQKGSPVIFRVFVPYYRVIIERDGKLLLTKKPIKANNHLHYYHQGFETIRARFLQRVEAKEGGRPDS